MTEAEVTQMCRATIVDTTFLGQSCVDSLGNEKSSIDIVQACVNDFQVLPKYHQSCFAENTK